MSSASRKLGRLNSAKPTWTVLKAMIVLGTKDAVDDLPQEAIAHLMPIFAPRNLFDWDALIKSNSGSVLSCQWTRCLFDVTNVALVHGLDRLHLFCLYHCCQRTAKELLEGQSLRGETKDCLSPNDLHSCVEGRLNLLSAFLPIIDTVLRKITTSHCDRAEYCHRVATLFSSKWRAHIAGTETTHIFPARSDPLGLPQVTFEGIVKTLRFCSRCTSTVETAYREERGRLWWNLRDYLSHPEPGASRAADEEAT